MFAGQTMYEYHQCQSCDAVYQVPIPGPDEIAGFYPDHYTVYDKHIKLKPRGAMERAVLNTVYGYSHLSAPKLFKLLAPVVSIFKYRNCLPYENGGQLLDIGCANGRFLLRMKALGWHVQGVEFNETAVKICRDHQLNVFHGALENANLESNFFDLITIRHVIEHVPDPDGFVADITHILKPGGRLHVRTPNSESLGRAIFRHYWYANDVPRHLILFSEKNLNMLAARHGLQPVKTGADTHPKLVLNSLDYIFGNRGKHFRKRKLLRLLAKLYVPLAKVTGRKDELFMIYRKP